MTSSTLVASEATRRTPQFSLPISLAHAYSNPLCCTWRAFASPTDLADRGVIGKWTGSSFQEHVNNMLTSNFLFFSVLCTFSSRQNLPLLLFRKLADPQQLA
jgi:hypothetical protein